MTLPVAILAGGLATRLGKVTAETPKSLLEVAGQSFIFHQLDLLRKNDIDRVVLCVGHGGERIQRALGDGRLMGMNLLYSFDGPKLLGTGGAIRRALPLLGETFFVLYGDSYLEVDYSSVSMAFRQSEKEALMTIFRNEHRWDRSNVWVKNGLVRAYCKNYPDSRMRHIDYGLGVFKSKAFADLHDDQQADMADLYRKLLVRGELASFEVTKRFYEIGSLAGLEETRSYLVSKYHSASCGHVSQRK